MSLIKNTILISAGLLAVAGWGCSKLDESLGSTFTNTQTSTALGSAGVGLILKGAYVDLGTPFTDQANIFSLEENSTDESLVPTRGGDWDDNGVWRVIHNHTWNADHSQVLGVFNNLNKLNFDATNVLAFSPSAQQAAEARFLRALSLYYLLDLYGQFPFRNPGDNLLNAPTVYSGDSAINFIIGELTTVLPDLASTTSASQAGKNAARMLLMKCYLNKGAFLNRASPTFADADMQQVITLGDSVIASGQYSYMTSYFDNFAVGNSASTELILAYPNTSGVSANNSGVDGEWMKTFHYNQYSKGAPNAGWNGFATISDFYNSFNVTGKAGVYGPSDTLFDPRMGGRYYPKVTPYSGIKPGLLVGQQYTQYGVALKDRKGNPLSYNPTIAANMIENGSNLEVTGIRIDKYPPDFSDQPDSSTAGKYYSSNSGNWESIFRYSDVVLMVAEAMMRKTSPDDAGALALVNQLRTARGASTLTTMPLVNTSNVDDPNTLLAERGRELWCEKVRRTDLIRFGVFNVIWQYKPSDAPTYLVYPIPTQALAANPNLKQNTGY